MAMMDGRIKKDAPVVLFKISPDCRGALWMWGVVQRGVTP